MTTLAPLADQSNGASSIVATADWITGVLVGPVGTSLAVIAVAWCGFEMLTGRMSPRRGGLVVLGCFVLFGAPLLVQSLMSFARGSGGRTIAPQQVTVPLAPAPRNPPGFDPYAGAAVPDVRN